MRDIKFRAWDGDRMQKVLTLGLNDYYISTNKISGDSEDFIVMQYTGIKDKNKEEIYEDDIVKGYYWEKGNEHRFIGQVKFLGGAYRVVGVNQYYGMREELNSVYEIIGDIHRNPDLIKR